MATSPRLITRRRVLLASAAAAGGGLLAACAATPQVVEKVVEQTVVVKETVVVEKEVPAAAGQPVIMTAHFTWSPVYEPRIKEWNDRFMEANPGIAVAIVWEPWSEWQTKILTLAAAGQMPELVAVHISRAQVLSKQGAILPLDEWIAADPEFDVGDYYPASLEMFTWQDKLYGFPWDWGASVLRYNRDLFDAAGAAYPTEDWTFDDLLDTAKTLTQGDVWGYLGLPSGSNESGPAHLGPWGGAFVNDDETECLVDTEESQAALQYWADLRLVHKVHPMPADQELLTAIGARPFLSGKIAMEWAAPWDAQLYIESAAFKWDLAPWPIGPVTRITGAAGSGYSIGRDTKHPNEAWKYLRWFASAEGLGFLFGEKATSLPSRRSLADRFLSAVSSIEHGYYWVEALDYSTLGRPILTPAREFFEIVRREYELLFLGEKSVAEAATAICTDAAPVLAQNKPA
ncbi:MAG: sugar ABC transporter substrate-binding protein [Anaerolineae bacterium]|nr:sugar ABC transporter substrate-binding protein [Anaerolineae bacterium]